MGLMGLMAVPWIAIENVSDDVTYLHFSFVVFRAIPKQIKEFTTCSLCENHV